MGQKADMKEHVLTYKESKHQKVIHLFLQTSERKNNKEVVGNESKDNKKFPDGYSEEIKIDG